MVNGMDRLDEKGFTLVELLAVFVLLAIIMGLGSYSIIGIINNSKQKDYDLLINNIKSAVEEHYIECKYDKPNIDGFDCSNEIYLSRLVEYGYLKANSADNSNKLVNPKDDKDISDCRISYSYIDGKISIVAKNQTGSCPTSY